MEVVNELQLSDSTQKHLFRMYSTVASNPNARELAFSNFVSPIKIVVTDYEGEFVDEIGKEGRGPEEILSARNFGFDNENNLVILDKMGALFKHFDRTTGEVTSYEYPIKQGVSITSRNLQMCKEKWYMGIQWLDKSTNKLLQTSAHTTVSTIGVFDAAFNMVDTLGGYDPFFRGRTGILQEPLVSVDCDNRRIYTTHAKIPFIQAFSIVDKKRITRTTEVPPSFMISNKFITMVTNPREWTRFMSEEQSASLHIFDTDKYIYHVFRNENNIYKQPRNMNDSDHFVAVYDKENLEFLGEIKLPGAVLGSTKDGKLIVLGNESKFEIQFISINPVSELTE